MTSFKLSRTAARWPAVALRQAGCVALRCVALRCDCANDSSLFLWRIGPEVEREPERGAGFNYGHRMGPGRMVFDDV